VKERVNAGKSSSQNLENCIEESKGINNETRTGNQKPGKVLVFRSSETNRKSLKKRKWSR